MRAEPPRARAVYRLQMRPGFGFEEAAGTAAYLARLGVTHLYPSPYFQAARGSTHGYDVVDHGAVSEELGGERGRRRLVAALREEGLGQLLDVVPNHMSNVDPRNRWWWDVLENGPQGRFASYFDVDWDPPESKLRDTVLLPILPDHYGRVLAAGGITVRRRGGAFTAHCGEHVLPLAPGSASGLLERAALRCGSEELGFLARAAGALSASAPAGRAGPWTRHRDSQVIAARLEDLSFGEPAVAGALEAELEALNGSAAALDELLAVQNYRLARWQVGGQELDYRRFFDVDTLVGLRVEDEQVFADTHELVLAWLAAGDVDGLRIDHVDGLRDPEAYLERLREASGGAWVVVEKILLSGERLPAWPVAGTTGYDFLNLVTGLFVDAAGKAPLTRLHASFTGAETGFEEIVQDRKHLVTREVLASDVDRLAAIVVRICEATLEYRDHTRREIREAVQELLCRLDVYRTYVRPQAAGAPPADTARLAAALEAAAAARPDLDPELLTFLGDVLTLRRRGRLESELVQRFQQTSGSVMAKSVEDSAFYAYARLAALNEVGGDPCRFGTSPDEFHRACREAAAARPLGLCASSTHDTKRSEDVRARLCLLSEIPERWQAAVHAWARLSGRHRRPAAPDPEMEYLFYQTLVGAHPLEAGRAAAYMRKASKEARARTSWTSPDEAYDEDLRAFVADVCGDAEFQASLAAFVAPLVGPGRVNALALKLLTLTAPGVPDIYQGSELWDLSLVDPDNRRPVDFELRARLLSEVEAMAAEEAWRRADEGLPKLLVVQRALAARRRVPAAFAPGGSYQPLEVGGPDASHVVAFERGGEAVTAVPRLLMGLAGRALEAHLALPPGRWHDAFTGAAGEGGLDLAAAWGRFPVSLLLREPA
ncbi:MAG: malto-oligosyltrehalose synthase [Candidatus Dormibacterales bacterium]